ncbi:hypothetical protein [Streptomyces lateritius]|uniref:hypothetical protein n=1 Tax=Streptomyces lateritius TaxID=67313 RepID=UPI001C8B7430|nr:hypothetical protein [Streptomyces lateritius]MBX9427540.1 hypothetical protein [Streptomyces lateritius]
MAVLACETADKLPKKLAEEIFEAGQALAECEHARAEAASNKATAKRDLSRRDNPDSARDDVPGQRNGSDPRDETPPSASGQTVVVTVAAPTQDLPVPWHDGAALMDAAFERLDAIQRSEFILRYLQCSHGVEAVITDMRGTLPAQARTSLAALLQQVSAGLLRDV